MKPTPPPWESAGREIFAEIDGFRVRIGATERFIVPSSVGTRGDDIVTSRANADLICRAVNSHDALVAAVRVALEALGPEDTDFPAAQQLRLTLRSALAAAEGEIEKSEIT